MHVHMAQILKISADPLPPKCNIMHGLFFKFPDIQYCIDKLTPIMNTYILYFL